MMQIRIVSILAILILLPLSALAGQWGGIIWGSDQWGTDLLPGQQCSSVSLAECINEMECTDATGNWCDNGCQVEVCEAISECSSSMIGKCITETECDDAGGSWCGDSCRIAVCPTETPDDDFVISNTCSGQFDSCVMLSTNGDFFDIGEQFSLDLELNVNQENRFERVDLYVAVEMPDGTMLYFTEDPFKIFSDIAQPFKSSLETFAADYHIFDFEVTPSLGGTYTVYAALNQEGESLDIFKLLSNIAIVKFTFR